jgi:DNA-binding CsgD family transcriptional regulator
VDARSLVGRERELAKLQQVLDVARDGGSGVLLLRGEPGIGKTALLDQVVIQASGFRIARAAGIEGEVDLPYAGLHQLCRSMLDTIDELHPPQREALRVAFGLTPGETPDRFLVGLAVLSLLSESAAAAPLLCVIDDAQWLDAETSRALGFVARRLGADTLAIVIATRQLMEPLADLPALEITGLALHDAHALLDSVLVGGLDGSVRERFLAETGGNPLALLELPRTLTPAEAATGILRGTDSLSERLEEEFGRRLVELPAQTRELLVLAAAEPLGDPLLLRRAADELGVPIGAADAAAEFFEIRERCSFRHPLVRSAAYRAATHQQRRAAHRALAVSTDVQRDPDRRAWHQAQATVSPDADVAAELERTAARAKSRGGLTAAAAFMERAAQLTPEPVSRAERTLTAAELMYEAGLLDAADALLRNLDARRLEQSPAARAERLLAEVNLARCAPGAEPDALRKLSAAAERLRLLDPDAGQAAHLAALRRAFSLAVPDVFEAVIDAVSAFPESESRQTVAMFLRGWSQMFTQGYPAGIDLLREAMVSLRDSHLLDESALPVLDFADRYAKTFWDLDSWHELTGRSVDVARESGALLNLPRALACLAEAKAAAGDLREGSAALAEANAIAEATGATGWFSSMILDALHLEGEAALTVFEERLRTGSSPLYVNHARAVVYNALGRYEQAADAADGSLRLRPLGVYGWAYVELVEAAVRCGDRRRAQAALEQLVVRTQVAGTDWALGLEARTVALLTDDPSAAEQLHLESITRLSRTRARPDLARAHLLYGERLRRQKSRIKAREHLRVAYEMFEDMEMPSFSSRAQRELIATGQTARKRTDDTRADLTVQETQIARLAAQGLTNPQIGAQLFLSPRTVEWHLSKVYPKLGIRSRRDLPAAMRSR